jgi:hypothetical protein
LLYRKPRDLMKAIASILDRIMNLIKARDPEMPAKARAGAKKSKAGA